MYSTSQHVRIVCLAFLWFCRGVVFGSGSLHVRSELYSRTNIYIILMHGSTYTGPSIPTNVYRSVHTVYIGRPTNVGLPEGPGIVSLVEEVEC